MFPTLTLTTYRDLRANQPWSTDLSVLHYRTEGGNMCWLTDEQKFVGPHHFVWQVNIGSPVRKALLLAKGVPLLDPRNQYILTQTHWTLVDSSYWP